MELSTDFSLLIILISLCHLDSSESSGLSNEVDPRKLLAADDVDQFLKQTKAFGEGFGSHWIVMPDGNGNPSVAVMGNPKTLPVDEIKLTSYNLQSASNLVSFHFYEKPKAESILTFSLTEANKMPFDPSKPTKIIFHGWMADTNSSVISNIKEAYLAEENVNVIGVDWSKIAADYYYPNSASATDVVGEIAANFINSLVENHQTKFSDIHLIGHSLGAHVAGFAGNFTKEKVGRITGLDPALPGFQSGPEGRLDSSDANFVDVIHTCAGILGLSIPVGHVDFYPNGGTVFQPGCTLNFIPQACSHSRAHEFFAESISKSSDFEAVRCKDWDHFKENKCENVFSIMGEHIPHDTKKGVYYLKTNYESPFSQGHGGIKY